MKKASVAQKEERQHDKLKATGSIPVSRTGNRYDLKTKVVARKLRQDGRSINFIAAKFLVAKSTAFLWVREVLLSRHAIKKMALNKSKKWLTNSKLGLVAIRERTRKQRKLWLKEASTFFREHYSEPLFMLGLGLYWGEGSKSQYQVSISNTDLSFHRVWRAWAKRYIPALKLVGRIHIHEGNSIESAKRYWSRGLGIDIVGFSVMKKRPPNKIRTNKWPRGILVSCLQGPGTSQWKFKILSWIKMLNWSSCDFARVVQQQDLGLTCR